METLNYRDIKALFREKNQQRKKWKKIDHSSSKQMSVHFEHRHPKGPRQERKQKFWEYLTEEFERTGHDC